MVFLLLDIKAINLIVIKVTEDNADRLLQQKPYIYAKNIDRNQHIVYRVRVVKTA